jgi:hypothetical protein
LRQQGQELDDLRTDFEEIKPATKAVLDGVFGAGRTRRATATDIKTYNREEVFKRAVEAEEATYASDPVAYERFDDQIREARAAITRGAPINTALGEITDESVKSAIKNQIDLQANMMRDEAPASEISQMDEDEFKAKLERIASAEQLSEAQRGLAIRKAQEDYGQAVSLDDESRAGAVLNKSKRPMTRWAM